MTAEEFVVKDQASGTIVQGPMTLSSAIEWVRVNNRGLQSKAYGVDRWVYGA